MKEEKKQVMNLRSFLFALAWQTPGASDCVLHGPLLSNALGPVGTRKPKKKKKRLGMGGRESGEGMKLTTRWPPDGAEKTFSLTSLSHLRWKHKSLLQPSF